MLGERGQAQVPENAHEPEVDLGARRRVAVLPLVIDSGDLDLRIRQPDPEHAPDMPVQHRDVELEVEADERPRPDEPQEVGQHLLDRTSSGDVLLAQAMDLDRVRIEPRPGLDHRLEALAGQDPVVANPDRGDRHDIVLARAEAGRLAVDRHRFARRGRIEQKTIGGIAEKLQPNPPLELPQHQNIARLKCRRKSSRRRFTTWKASRRRSRSMVDSSPGLTRLVETFSAICASRRSVIR